MRNKGPGRVAALLICAFLLLGTFAPFALAYAEPDDSFTIRITPPAAAASGEAAPVEILVTDSAGDGFKNVQVRKGKSRTWQIITSDMEKRENRYYGSTMITENCTVYVRVTSNGGKFYENSKYIECFGTSGAEQPVSASTDPDAVPDTAPRSKPLTPDGAASVLDNADSGDGKEFFTFTTPAENVFYLVIDKQRQDKNVYFLNAVTEKDLMALAQTEDAASGTAATPAAQEPKKEEICTCTDKCAPGEVNADCPVCVLSWRNCKGVAHDHDGDADGGDTQPQPPKRTGTNGGSLAVMLIVALGAGGAGYYVKIYKPKKELEGAEDLDELTDAEEPTVNEDGDEQEQPADADEGAFDGPDYSDYDDYRDEYGDGPESPEE